MYTLIILFVVILLLLLLFLPNITSKNININNKNIIDKTYKSPTELSIAVKQFHNNLQKKNKNSNNIKSKTIYRNGTFTDKIINYIKPILNNLINNLDKISNTNHKLNEIDIIIAQKYTDDSIKYTIDFFIYDLNNFKINRLITNFVVLNNKLDFIDLNFSNNHEPIPFTNETKTHNKNINTILAKKTENESLPFIEGIESNYKYTSLEKSPVDFSPSNCYPKSSDRNSWINPKNIKKYNVFPSRNVYNTWDEKGVQMIDSENKDNTGINSSTTLRPIVGNFNPSLIGLPRDNLGLHSQFNLSLGIPSFPTGHSLGSGHKSI